MGETEDRRLMKDRDVCGGGARLLGGRLGTCLGTALSSAGRGSVGAGKSGIDGVEAVDAADRRKSSSVATDARGVESKSLVGRGGMGTLMTGRGGGGCCGGRGCEKDGTDRPRCNGLGSASETLLSEYTDGEGASGRGGLCGGGPLGTNSLPWASTCWGGMAPPPGRGHWVI